MQKPSGQMSKNLFKNVLITGATGYLGRNVLPLFLSRSDTVYVLKRKSSNLDGIADPKITFVEIEDIEKFDQKIDLVFHAATNYGRNGETKEEILEVNCELPLRILKLLNHENLIWINTDTALPSDFNDYTTSKFLFLEKLNQINKGKSLSLLLQQFYGPGDGTFVSFIVKSLLNNVEKLDLTKGTQKRDFIYIKDLVNAIELIVENLDKLKSYKSIEVGSGNAFELKALVVKIKELIIESTTSLNFGAREYRENEPMLMKADISVLKSLGFKLGYDLEKGLSETIQQSLVIK